MSTERVTRNPTNRFARSLLSLLSPLLPTALAMLIAVAMVACDSTTSGTTVSGGTAQVSVPSVLNDTQAAATTALTSAGLTLGTVTQQSSAAVASGKVISENPAANASVAKGSTVALVISTGPSAFTIGGAVIGLEPAATVHVLNGVDSVLITVNGSFTLPTSYASGATYSVSLESPSPSGQTCAVANGTGAIASANVTNVVVYCTYAVTTATLNSTYTTVAAVFDAPSNGATEVLDEIGADSFNAMGASSSVTTVNAGGTITDNVPGSGSYGVATTNAIPALTDGSFGGGGIGSGGIEGVNADSYVAVGTESGATPGIAIGVLPNPMATTDSVNGTYTQVGVLGVLSTGGIIGYEGSVTLSNGALAGTLTLNTAGTIVPGTQDSGQFTISNGLLSAAGGSQQGAVSADGDLIVVANTAAGGSPGIGVMVPQATAASNATFEGVYSIAAYGGNSTAAPADQLLTAVAHGNGTYSISYTEDNNGIVTTGENNGTYAVAANGTLTLTGSSGDVHNGAISADGNALVLASIKSGETPTIYVGLRE